MLPVLALMVMGLVDFARVFHQYIAAANAAREGARYCALNPGASQTNLWKRVVDSSTTPNTAELGGRFPNPDVTVVTWLASAPATTYTACPTTAQGATEGADVVARVTIAFRPITPLVDRFFPQNPLPVGGSAMMIVPPQP